MLQNARATDFTVSEFFRENQQWVKLPPTRVKQINSLQRHAIRIIHCKYRFAHARELFRGNKILDVFQLNISNKFVVMYIIKSQTAPKQFQKRFGIPSHKYPAKIIPLFKLSKFKYTISIRGPTLWKNIPKNSEKIQEV